MIDNYDTFDTSQVAFERFDWDNIAAKYLEMYRAILSPAPVFR